MSNTIKQMTTRSSIRAFDPNKKISTEILDQILSATQQSPNYAGAQQYSVIVITDEQQKENIVKCTMASSGKAQSYIKNCSAFLLFVIDFHKINLAMQMENEQMEVTNHLESLLIGTVDVGIGIEAATVAAESLGLGTVMIGAIRKATKDLIDEYKLPEYTFPVVGLCIGHPLTEPVAKPRLPKETFVHYGEYKTPQNIKEMFENYNEVIEKYYEEHMNIPNFKWTAFISNYYKRALYPNNFSIYKQQKFNIQ